MTVTIKKGRACGKICAPPSKSFAHRMLVCAALAGNSSVVSGISESEDMLATLDCLRALGAVYEKKENTVVFEKMRKPENEPRLYCRESGSTLRFLMPLSCAVCCGAEFVGTKRLMERGVGIYDEIFALNGVSVEKSDGSVRLDGRLSAGEYSVRGDVSSQFITGLLFALPLLDGDSVINVLPPVESRAYIDITLSVLKTYGIAVEGKESNRFFIKGGQRYLAVNSTVEGDWSNSAFFTALGFLGGNVTVEGLKADSVQGDRVCNEYFKRLLKGAENIDISDCPDLGPILFAFAAANHGGCFTGTRRLKIKESDRVASMAQELAKFGVTVRDAGNEVTVSGGLKTPTQTLCGHNDHRIVMALSVLLTLTGGSICEAQAVRKSFPGFFETLSGLGLEAKCED